MVRDTFGGVGHLQACSLLNTLTGFVWLQPLLSAHRPVPREGPLIWEITGACILGPTTCTNRATLYSSKVASDVRFAPKRASKAACAPTKLPVGAPSGAGRCARRAFVLASHRCPSCSCLLGTLPWLWPFCVFTCFAIPHISYHINAQLWPSHDFRGRDRPGWNATILNDMVLVGRSCGRWRVPSPLHTASLRRRSISRGDEKERASTDWWWHTAR